MIPKPRRLCALVVPLLAAFPASGQCPNGAWVQSPSLYRAGNESFGEGIFALMPWDPDGPGPLDPVLVVAGTLWSAQPETQPRNIATWDGTSFRSLGLGLNRMEGGTEYGSYVSCLTTFRGDLIAAGQFLFADGSPASNIARWDGAAWHPLGQGLNDAAGRLAVYNDQLYATGAFTTAGGVPALHIAAWDGAAWHALGSGFGDGGAGVMCVFQNQLIVGGSFTHVGGISANHLAAWNGTTWQQYAGGVQGTVSALAVFLSDLVAGESARFYDPDTQNLTNIISWDGASWRGLGTGTSTAPLGLTALGTDLFATGSFDTAGGVAANHVARWDSTFPLDWEPVEAGYEAATAAGVYNHEFVTGGYDRFGLWVAPTAPPQISGQPAPQTANTGSAATFHVEVIATSAVSYQWRREGADLTDNARTSGAHQSTLVVSPVQTADAAHYSCHITTACGNPTSASALLTVIPVCGSADFNHDGDTATDADIEAFFACLAGNCCPRCDSADFNADGDSGTDADIEAFFRVLAGGSC